MIDRTRREVRIVWTHYWPRESESDRNTELDHLLECGWEPFAAGVDEGPSEWWALRKQRPHVPLRAMGE